jgi:hypothetical protein
MAKHRVCIIGNSHAAALRSGLDLVPELNEKLAFDFFAAQSDLMREMELQGAVLVPTSELTKRRMSIVSGGKLEIKTADYTEFVIVGLGFNVLDVVNVLRKYRLHEFQGKGDEAPQFISRACFEALIESMLRASTAVYFARLLRCASRARILVIPQPYPSSDILKDGIWKQAAESGLLTYVAQRYEDIARRLVEGLQCEIMFQPAGTLLQDGITQAMYSVGSGRLGAEKTQMHPSGEASHMNALFGAETLRAVESCFVIEK